VRRGSPAPHHTAWPPGCPPHTKPPPTRAKYRLCVVDACRCRPAWEWSRPHFSLTAHPTPHLTEMPLFSPVLLPQIHALPMSTCADVPLPAVRATAKSKGAGEDWIRGAALDLVGDASFKHSVDHCSDALVSWLGARVAVLESQLEKERKATARVEKENDQLVDWVRSVEWVDLHCVRRIPGRRPTRNPN
jgi:hypothetical protein